MLLLQIAVCYNIQIEDVVVRWLKLDFHGAIKDKIQ